MAAWALFLGDKLALSETLTRPPSYVPLAFVCGLREVKYLSVFCDGKKPNCLQRS